MKIAIIWTHWVWKTTLVDRINLGDSGMHKIQEVARDIITNTWVNPQDMTRHEKLVFQMRIYNEQIRREAMYDNFISDRSRYDNLAYLKHVNEGLFDAIITVEKQKENQYDKIIYLPIEFPLVLDGVRYSSDKFQRTIDNTILDILEILGYEYETVTWSIEERTNKVLWVIESFNSNNI